MTADTDTPPGAATSPLDATAGPLRKRRLADREIIERRAQGELLKPLAEAAGIGVPTLSEWLRRPNIAAKLADASTRRSRSRSKLRARSGVRSARRSVNMSSTATGGG